MNVYKSGSRKFRFQQVDVFSCEPMLGNPLAVVIDADDLPVETMLSFARWTNLSETTFLLRPTVPGADYRGRIFTPAGELPFAGHPTLGTCHVWLANNGGSRSNDIIQQCEAGLIRIRDIDGRLAFAAPALVRQGSIDPGLLKRVCAGLHLQEDTVIDAQWVDNGPGWLALLLKTRADVLAVRPDFAAISGVRVGIVAACEDEGGSDHVDFEVRAFTAAGFEDPVTGSLNAGIAQWLIGSGIAPPSYVAAQGTVVGRKGRLHVSSDGQDIWIGGDVATCIEGTVAL
ncbi:PhzF family phenazine biosynthesis protein [Agrobacterium rhizogenes]|uniref:PhzF family phenazine biosynthesis protein n=1 Tax=Rhizobium rhizogenes TaxID=359 RepID=UPI0022B704FF|nr:PhzF family phenazine biosynthesis protein [Rhizobium rhizogenes]MCZ7450699.1 PhzF family phenazine biosynthesis protein [Rhizobium rhizogenes]